MSLFKPGFSYPSDREGGRYIELTAEVIEIIYKLEGDIDDFHLRVRTESGVLDGWLRVPSSSEFVPKVGHHTIIRVYDIGGGWYPDNRINSCGPPTLIGLKREMRFLVELMTTLTRTGTKDQVAELLVSCDNVLSRETQADKELVEELVGLCNRRLEELNEEAKVPPKKAQ